MRCQVLGSSTALNDPINKTEWNSSSKQPFLPDEIATNGVSGEGPRLWDETNPCVQFPDDQPLWELDFWDLLPGDQSWPNP